MPTHGGGCAGHSTPTPTYEHQSRGKRMGGRPPLGAQGESHRATAVDSGRVPGVGGVEGVGHALGSGSTGQRSDDGTHPGSGLPPGDLAHMPACWPSPQKKDRVRHRYCSNRGVRPAVIADAIADSASAAITNARGSSRDQHTHRHGTQVPDPPRHARCTAKRSPQNHSTQKEQGRGGF